MDRILVTGGTGFVGFNLLQQLCKLKSKITATYISETKLKKIHKIINDYFQTDKGYFDKIEWKKINILDSYSLEKLVVGIDYIYHCAALVSFDTKMKKNIMRVNVTGTANIVNSALNHKIKKMIYVSSIATLDKHKKISYDSNITHYGYSKYQAELEVWRGIEEGLNAVIVNPGVILGKTYIKNSATYLYNLTQKNIGIYPPGGTGFIMVEDVVKALLLLKEKETSEKQYCLVAENMSFQRVLKNVAESINKKEPKTKLTKRFLKTLSFFEWILSIFFLSKRILSKGMIKTLTNFTSYDGSIISEKNDFTYTSIEKGIESISKEYLNFKNK